jgi:hypothetical protein
MTSATTPSHYGTWVIDHDARTLTLAGAVVDLIVPLDNAHALAELVDWL